MARGSQAGINGRGGRGAIDGDGSGGSGSVSLTATYVGFGSGANAVTGSAQMTWNDTTKVLAIDSKATDTGAGVLSLYTKGTQGGTVKDFVTFSVRAIDVNTVEFTDYAGIYPTWLNTEGTIDAGTAGVTFAMGYNGVISASNALSLNGMSVGSSGGLSWTGAVGTNAAPVPLAFNTDSGINFRLVGGTEKTVDIVTGGAYRVSVDSTAVAFIPPAYFAAGTNSLPSISRTGDTNTGIYFSAADQVAIATGGSNRITVANGTTTVGNALTVSGTLTANDSGGVYSAGPYFAPNGTAGAPSHSFSNDTDCGMFRNAADQIAWSTGGIARVYVNADYFNSQVKITCATSGDATTPAYSWEADTDCGLYRIGANNIAIATNGAKLIDMGAAALGFHGTAAIAKPTVTGSRGANAALASLCTALSNYGLITDSTS